MKTNPNAMKTIQKNTIFTNVGETSDGGVYWEGIDKQLAPGITLTSWKNTEWTAESGKKSRGEALPAFFFACLCKAAVVLFLVQGNLVLTPIPDFAPLLTSAQSLILHGRLRKGYQLKASSLVAGDLKVRVSKAS